MEHVSEIIGFEGAESLKSSRGCSHNSFFPDANDSYISNLSSHITFIPLTHPVDARVFERGVKAMCLTILVSISEDDLTRRWAEGPAISYSI